MIVQLLSMMRVDRGTGYSALRTLSNLHAIVKLMSLCQCFIQKTGLGRQAQGGEAIASAIFSAPSTRCH